MPLTRSKCCWLSILSLLTVASLAGCGTDAEPLSAVLEPSAALLERPSSTSAPGQLSLQPASGVKGLQAGHPVGLSLPAAGPSAASISQLAALTACQPSSWSVLPQVSPGNILTGVASGGGLYVAVGFNGEILTSSNGVAWSDLSPTSQSFNYYDVAYGGGSFVAVGDQGLINFLSGPVTGAVSFGSGVVLSGVAYGNGAWVAVGGYLDSNFQWYSMIFASTDGGRSWNAVSMMYASGALGTHSDVAFGNGVFVVTNKSGDIFYSSNGTSWGYGGYIPADLNFVTFGGGTFLTGTKTGELYSSSTGLSWSKSASLGSTSWFDAAYQDGTWAVVGQGGRIVSSTGGGAWVDRTSGTSDNLESVTAGPAAWVSVGTTAPGNQRIVTSSCPLPDLAPYTPSGWSAPIVLSTQPGTSTNSSVITAANSIYIDLAWANFGNADAGPFNVLLTLQGSSLGTISSGGLVSLSYQGMTDITLSPLPAGTYTLTMSIDSGGSVTESSESNNSYSRTFTVSP